MSVISIPTNFARICEPPSFWNFSAATPSALETNNPAIAVAAIALLVIANASSLFL